MKGLFEIPHQVIRDGSANDLYFMGRDGEQYVARRYVGNDPQEQLIKELRKSNDALAILLKQSLAKNEKLDVNEALMETATEAHHKFKESEEKIAQLLQMNDSLSQQAKDTSKKVEELEEAKLKLREINELLLVDARQLRALNRDIEESRNDWTYTAQQWARQLKETKDDIAQLRQENQYLEEEAKKDRLLAIESSRIATQVRKESDENAKKMQQQLDAEKKLVQRIADDEDGKIAGLKQQLEAEKKLVLFITDEGDKHIIELKQQLAEEKKSVLRITSENEKLKQQLEAEKKRGDDAADRYDEEIQANATKSCIEVLDDRLSSVTQSICSQGLMSSQQIKKLRKKRRALKSVMIDVLHGCKNMILIGGTTIWASTHVMMLRMGLKLEKRAYQLKKKLHSLQEQLEEASSVANKEVLKALIRCVKWELSTVDYHFPELTHLQ